MSRSEEINNFVLKRVKRAFRHQPQKYHKFLSILKAVNNSAHNPKALSRMSLRLQALLSTHPDLVQGINRFLPPSHKLSLIHNQHHNHPVAVDDIQFAVDFAKAVKQRSDAATYNQFLDALNLYRKGCYEDEFMFRRDICGLFKGHPDLQHTFTTFISQEVDPLEAQGLALCNKVKTKVGPDDYQSFLKTLHLHSNGLITGVELQMTVADLVQNCPLVLDDLARFMEASEKPHRKKKKKKGTGALDHTSVEDIIDSPEHGKVNPSYRLRPKGASTQEQEVLNDTWETVRNDDGYGYVRFKSKEERMRELWDDVCYEYDMVIHQARSTATYAQEQLDILRGRPCYKVQFSGTNLCCVKSLYRDEDEYVVQLMLQDPLRCLPVIISRLRHKEEEWTSAFAKWRAEHPTPRRLKWSDTCLRHLKPRSLSPRSQ